MDEILDSILKAEEKAEQIIAEKTEIARKILADGEIKAEKIKNDSVALFKVHRKKTLSDAENSSAGNYQTLIENGKSDADRLIESAEKFVDSVSDKIVEEILG